jgi:hypothetical protein
MNAHAQAPIEKIQTLPPERLDAVEDFVDFLHQSEQQRSLMRAAMEANAPAFAAIWANPDDAAYDAL